MNRRGRSGSTPYQADLAIEVGLDVICDKPVAVSLRQALDLRDRQRRTGRVFALTHNFTGYAMVCQAREMVRDGALGEIRIVQVEFAQVCSRANS